MDFVSANGHKTMKFHNCEWCVESLYQRAEELHDRFVEKFGESETENEIIREIRVSMKELNDDVYWLYYNDSGHFQCAFNNFMRHLEFLWHKFHDDERLFDYMHELLGFGAAIMQ